MIQSTFLRPTAFLPTILASILIASSTAGAEETILVERGLKGWHYWDQGKRPPEAWDSKDFDDSAWETGSAPLGYGEDDIATTISFGEDDKNKHPTAFFRLTFNVDDPEAHPVWLGELRCDDGAAVYLNGKEVYRYNMATGDLAEATFSAGTLSSAGNRESQYHPFYLDGGHFEAGENVLAISVHQADSGSSDLVMDFALKGVAETIIPKTKPLHSDGVLEADSDIAKYIDRWGKHLLKQDRAPNPSRLISGLSGTLDRKVDLIEPSNIPLSPEGLYERCAPGVLIISAVSEDKNRSPGSASGFVISADGLALTNHHVMRNLGTNADLVVATTLSGRVVRVKEVLAANEADDVALIQLDGDGFHPLPIAKSVPVGSDLVTISHPRRAFFTLTKGQLARHTREKGQHRIMVTSEFALGSSGAPIVDRFGSVAGMVEMTRSIAYNTVPVHEEEGALKLGRGDRDRGLFLSMNHQMTLRYAVPGQSMRAFLQPSGEGPVVLNDKLKERKQPVAMQDRPQAAYPKPFSRPPAAGNDYNTWADAQGPDVGAIKLDPKHLPKRVDNSQRPEYPPIYAQGGHGNCGQYASVTNIFGYEQNVLNGTVADSDATRFSPYFSWNMMNRAENKGSEAYHGWEVAKRLGIPTAKTYGGVKFETIGLWPDGYTIWREAMEYRLKGYRYSPVGTLEQLQEAKGWLFNRHQPGKTGGLLAMDGRMGKPPERTFTIAKGEHEEGKLIWTRWNPTGFGHGMACVGYDDEVGYDVNGDGKITNGIDTNSDGKVTLADWERGAYIVANSWGEKWSAEGRIYLLYSAMIDPEWKRGNYLGRVEVSRYQPRATLRLKLSCNERSHLRTRIGIAGDVNAENAQHEMTPEVLNGWTLFRGSNPGAVPIAGPGVDKPIELGVDVSELFDRLGKDEDGMARLFLDFGRAKKSEAEGQLHACALRQYDTEGKLILEVPIEVQGGEFGEDELTICTDLALHDE